MATLAAAPAEATVQSGVVEKLVSVTLTESDYQAIQNTKQDFAAVAQYLMEQFARGGAMVPADQITYLSDLTHIPIYGADDLVEIVENTARRNSPDGTLRVNVDVDPAFAPALEERAYMQGRTPQEIMTEVCSLVLCNGWLYDLNTSGGTIYLLEEQRVILEKIIKKSPLMSTDLVAWVQAASEPTSTSDARRPKPRPEPSPEPVPVIQVSDRKLSKVQKKVMEKLR